jgi:GT2 family glycosyltransferase/glycosyltransferase involved in cell wall biosynthesis
MDIDPVVAVVVTYNPDLEGLFAVVEGLAPALARVVVVDNSDEPAVRSVQASVERAGGHYIAAGGNIGIAAAQNRGMREALELEPEAILLLDDDSRLEASDVTALLRFLRARRVEDESVAAVAPRIVDRRTREELNPVIVDHRLKLVPIHEVTEAAFLLGSGTLLHIDALERYGYFRDEYFIDHVDKEWGYRVRSMGGRLLITPDVTLWHQLGGDPTTRGKKVVNYVQTNPARHYYMVRNSLLLMRDVKLPPRQQAHEVMTFGKIMVRRVLSPNEPLVTKRAVVAGLVEGVRGRRTKPYVRRAGGSRERSASEQPVRGIRVVPDLRASQVADAAATPDVHVLYFRRHYDLGSTELSSMFRQVTIPMAMWELARTPARTFELPEPLWVRFLPTGLALAAAWYAGRMRHRERRRIRAYAIENNDLASIVFGKQVPMMLDRATRVVLGGVIRVVFSRFAWGSEGARENYRSIPFVRSIPARLFLELPPRPSDTGAPESPHSAVFIGHLHDRKGVRETMQAWRFVEDRQPDARLIVIGVGPLQGEVEAWVRERPETRTYLGQVEHSDLPGLLRQAAVLVAPSARDGRWREQIGLPIVEALAEGVTIVTTTETGLAPWLQREGHRVVGPDASATELAMAIESALTSPLPREAVASALPERSPRADAARWLVA